MNGLQKTSSLIWFSAIILALLLLLPASAFAQSASSTSDSDNDAAVVVDVWAAGQTPLDSGETAGPALSKGFVVASLQAMSAMRDWQNHLAYMIRNGYPLAEQWISEDSNVASDRLLLAAQAAQTTADRSALTELNNQYRNLEQWSDSMVEAKQQLQLAQLYMSPAGLEGDLLFQKTVECANFLTPMLASGRLRESVTCQ